MVALLILLILLLPLQVSASVLSTAASGMSTGTFSQITGSTGYNRHSIQGGIFVPDEFGCGTGDFITQYATDAVYDPVNDVIRFMGQTHGTCTGGQFIRYTIATDTWDVLPWPSAFAGQFNGQCGGGPCLAHADEMWNTIDPATGIHYTWYSNKTLKYNPTTAVWSAIGAGGSEPHPTATNTLEYFPEMGKNVFCNGIYGCWSIDTTTGAFTYIAKGEQCFSNCTGLPNIFTSGDQQYNNQLLYMPQKHVLIFIIGPSIWKIDASGTFTKLANCPVSCGLTESVPAIDPVSSELVLISNASSHVWAYNYDTNAWRDTGITYPSMLMGGFQPGNGSLFVAASLSTYGVIWYGKYAPGTAGVANGTWLYKHSTGTPDTTAPSAPTGLTATAISGSQINLSWTASTDNIGVTGYNVERCAGAACANFVQVYTPVSITQNDTGLSASTLYRYRVRAHDGAGNLSGYSSIVQATTLAGGGSDFTTRCAAAGVVRCFSFDDNSQLGGTYGDNFGYFNNANTSHSACGQDAFTLCPVIDQTVFASGTGSLKLTIPSGGGSGSAGQWFTNFSSDLATQFGASSEFYVQWRQRFDTNYVNNAWPNFKAGGEGPKQAIIGNGDLPGCTPANSNSGGPCRSSNDGLATVVQDVDQHGYAMMYHYIGGSTIRFEGTLGNGDLSWQNTRPSPFCTYQQWLISRAAQFPPNGNCFGYFANEWMTFKVRIKPGPLSGGFWINSLVELWIGREGQALQKVMSVTSSLEANDQYGKIWLLPYISNLPGGDFSYATANTWYDELIISAQDIADPGGGVAPPVNVKVSSRSTY